VDGLERGHRALEHQLRGDAVARLHRLVEHDLRANWTRRLAIGEIDHMLATACGLGGTLAVAS